MRRHWLWLVAFFCYLGLFMIFLSAQEWTPMPKGPRDLLHGWWQSCREDQGYAERIYDYCVKGQCLWSLHLGPQNEFALYRYTESPDGDSHVHSGPQNLLAPHYTVEAEYGRGRRAWGVPALSLWVSINLAGGATSDCESYVVLVGRQP